MRLKKKLGQHFLVDQNVINKLVRNISPNNKDIIVEIGPGDGAMTKLILPSVKKMYLIEKDIDLVNELVFALDKYKNSNIINQDVLKYTPELEKYSVVANIPYYITSPILRHFIYDVEHIPESMIILMQKDVGDKILWYKKNKSSVISLFVNKKYQVEEIIKVPKENFIPAPKVESSILLFEKHNLYGEIDNQKFLTIIKIWFSSSRKKLISNLVAWGFQKHKVLSIFKELEIEENARWEDLDISQWCDIVKAL